MIRTIEKRLEKQQGKYKARHKPVVDQTVVDFLATIDESDLEGLVKNREEFGKRLENFIQTLSPETIKIINLYWSK